MMLGWPVVAVANWRGEARLVTAAAGIWSGWGAGTWRGSGCLAGRCCLAGTWLAGASGGWLCSVASGCGRAGGSDLGRAGAGVVLSGTGLAGGLGARRDGAGVKLAIRTSEIGDDAGIKRLAGMLAGRAGKGWRGCWHMRLAVALAGLACGCAGNWLARSAGDAWLAEINVVAGVAGDLAVPKDGWRAGCLRPVDSGLLAISVFCLRGCRGWVNRKIV